MEEELIPNITPASWVKSDSIIKVIGVGGGGCNAGFGMFALLCAAPMMFRRKQ